MSLNVTMFESGYAVFITLLFISLKLATYFVTFEESSDVNASIVMFAFDCDLAKLISAEAGEMCVFILKLKTAKRNRVRENILKMFFNYIPKININLNLNLRGLPAVGRVSALDLKGC